MTTIRELVGGKWTERSEDRGPWITGSITIDPFFGPGTLGSEYQKLRLKDMAIMPSGSVIEKIEHYRQQGGCPSEMIYLQDGRRFVACEHRKGFNFGEYPAISSPSAAATA